MDRCERIWRSNLHIMLNIARARLWNKQDAEDLVQDVTFAFWRKYTDVDYLPDDRLCMYLFGILRNKIAEQYQSAQTGTGAPGFCGQRGRAEKGRTFFS